MTAHGRFHGVFALGSALLLAAACTRGGPPPATAALEAAPPPPPPHLEAARSVAAWLRSVAVETADGRAWPDDAGRAGPIGIGLGTGVTGPVLFFTALYRVTGDPRDLADARRGADYLLARLPADLASGQAPGSLYSGVAGVGFALGEVFRAGGEEKYRAGALRCVDLLERHARAESGGVTWNGSADVLAGASGTGLFLLYAARELGHPGALDLATRAGRWLTATAIPDRGGLTWKAFPGRDFILPNFSHGAAGIAYFLAGLHQATGEREFLDAALAGARYLQAVARTEDGAFLVPYGWPDAGWERPFDAGWGHGPSGTARLFYRLYRITGDEAWMDLVLACARGERQSGLPGAPRPPFGTAPFSPERRFGAAGVADFFLGLHRATGEREHLDFARALVDHVLAQATVDAAGTRWTLPRFSFMEDAGQPGTFTGYLYGASGFGLLLLQMDAEERGAGPVMALPDDPFAAGR